MPKRSIRWRLQAWYALVLLCVVFGFAGVLYYRVSSARYQEVDSSLVASAQYLDATLRSFPPPMLGHHGPFDPGPPFPEGEPPPPPHEPRDGSRPPGPHPRGREHSFAEIDLPQRRSPDGHDDGPQSEYFAIWRDDGALIKASASFQDQAEPSFARGYARPGIQRLVQRDDQRMVVTGGPGRTEILVGRSIRREREDLRAFAWQLTGAGALVLAIGLTGGWYVSARILRPLASISATAASISATNLSERIDAAAVDEELQTLAHVLNEMFDRLEAAFERQARFTADASHELRTPLAIVRSHAELALSRQRSPAEYRETIEATLRAANRMGGLVEGLLTLARADAGKLDMQRQKVDAKLLVEEAVDMLRPLAGSKDVQMQSKLEALTIVGDPLRLGQLVANLIANALQYNSKGGSVTIELGQSDKAVVLTVRDTGCGISAEDRPHIFERFYRVDKARARASGGNGLGLAICRSIVQAHGGTIEFESEIGKGSTFKVTLPMV
jgi:heavy metal sensor kinase